MAIVQRQSSVVARAHAVPLLGEAFVRWKLEKGQWQRPWPGVLVTHNGPLTAEQRLWVALVAAGHGAVIAGLSAASLDGLAGIATTKIWLLVSSGRKVRTAANVRVRRSAFLGPEDVHPLRTPPRTRMPRSLVDACRWATSDDQARLILAAGLQQRWARASDIRTVLARTGRVRRQRVITTTLADVEGGSHSIPELDFIALVRRYGLPEPDRQVIRHDENGRARWLDVHYDGFQLVIEVDGMWHMDPIEWWSDMERQNDLVIGRGWVLRFPSFVVRERQERVARQVALALLNRGWTPLTPLQIPSL